MGRQGWGTADRRGGDARWLERARRLGGSKSRADGGGTRLQWDGGVGMGGA